MHEKIEIHLSGMEKARSLMTPEQYRDFCDRLATRIKPELDQQREARRASEKAARHHLVF